MARRGFCAQTRLWFGAVTRIDATARSWKLWTRNEAPRHDGDDNWDEHWRNREREWEREGERVRNVVDVTGEKESEQFVNISWTNMLLGARSLARLGDTNNGTVVIGSLGHMLVLVHIHNCRCRNDASSERNVGKRIPSSSASSSSSSSSSSSPSPSAPSLYPAAYADRSLPAAAAAAAESAAEP